VTPEQVPVHLKAILDQRAGKDHSTSGAVMECLAEILTAHEADLRTEWEAKIQTIWDETQQVATRYGTTYGVDAVGRCLLTIRGQTP
jgi:hypothetical protein